MKVTRTVRVHPVTEIGLVSAMEGTRFGQALAKRLDCPEHVVPLSPKLSVALLDALLEFEKNRGAIRSVASGLRRPPSATVESLQLDAVETAMKAFGLAADAPAINLDLARRSKSALARARIMEDAAIEHDARVVPGYDFVSSEVTGRAIFRKGGQTLEVYTANRRKLEEAFGVDLIYLNLFQSNVVMVQYKMLETGDESDSTSDWIYYQDQHLHKQLVTMRLYGGHRGAHTGYRLNSDAFYFKFVRRSGIKPKTNVLLPLSHFELMLKDSKYRTRTGNIRVSYQSLEGRYMRQTAFFNLLQAGYIGADANCSADLKLLVEEVVGGDKALVIAVQRLTRDDETESDGRRNFLREY